MQKPMMLERIIPFTVDAVAYPPFLCTPDALSKLAVGFLLTQGCIVSAQEIEEVKASEEGVCVTTHAGVRPISLLTERLDAMMPNQSEHTMTIADARTLMDALVEQETFFGTHCVAIQTPAETRFFEDIGRHNAMDKAIGFAAMAGADFANCVVAATGRISLEMLVKAASVGIPILLSKKYPSDLSDSLAQRFHIGILARAGKDNPDMYGDTTRFL